MNRDSERQNTVPENLPPNQPGASEAFYGGALNRIRKFMLVLAPILTVLALREFGRFAALGFLLGCVIAYLNFRWLKQGVHALARLSTAQEGSEKPRVPRSVYVKSIGRYALLIAAAYAILRGFRLPAASLLAGVFVVVAAVLAEMIGQLFRGGAGN
jgi:small-conductance mechanosensitive channel